MININTTMLIYSFLALLALYVVANYVGSRFEYKKAYWFFEVSHFLGGFLIALFLSNFFSNPTIILAGAFFIGFLWEIEELIVDRNEKIKSFLAKLGMKSAPMTLPDTLLDLFLDVVGALVFIYFFL